MPTRVKDTRLLPFQFILKNSLKDYRDFVIENSPKPTVFKKNTVISESGFAFSGAYFLLNGMIKISTVNINGYERILGYHKENTFFAMDGLRADESVVVTTTALVDTTAIFVSTDKMTKLFEMKPQFATDTLMFYSDVLKFMCYDAESQFGSSVLFKLANFITLYMQSEEYKKADHLPFTQYELASAIGASRIQVARICSDLKKQGHVDTQKRKIHIVNPDYFYDILAAKA